MLRRLLQQLLLADPFEPFRIKLVTGDTHDISDPSTTVVLEGMRTVFVAPSEQSWCYLPMNKIARIESLIEDYQGELARHSST